MVITEADLRDQVRRPTEGAQVVIPTGASMTPSARDFVKQWKLEVVDASSHAAGTTTITGAAQQDRAWDHSAVFPVDFTGDRPRCMTCGEHISHKPDSLTQLNSAHFAPKTHPRIRLRGKFDSLNAVLMMAANRTRAAGNHKVASLVDTLAAYCREMLSAEYNERPAAALTLPGADAEQIHAATHDPSGRLGIEHLTLGSEDIEAQHWLNMARSQARELELDVLELYPSPHDPVDASMTHAMNRLSSAVYYCQLLLAGGMPR